MQACTRLSRFILVLSDFLGKKHKKIHRLLYHSLCTNMAKDCCFNKAGIIVNY